MKNPRFLSTGIGAILALVPVTMSAGDKTITASAGNGTAWGTAASWGPAAGVPTTEDRVSMLGTGFVNISGSAFSPVVTSTSVQDLTFNGTGSITLQNADTVANMNLILNGFSTFVPLISTTNGQLYTVQNGTSRTLTLTLGASGIFDVASGGNLNITSNILQDASQRFLTKTGKGTLLLAGTNSFTGITSGTTVPALTVEEGKVTLSGSLATGSQIAVAPSTFITSQTSLLDITANAVNPYAISVAPRGTLRLGTGGRLGGTTSTISLTGASGVFGGAATANIDSTTGSVFTMNVNSFGIARINAGGVIAAGSTVNVNSGGIITGVGTVNGNTTINTGGLIQSGSSGIGTLTFSNLTFANGATRIQTTTDSKIVTTALTVNGGNGSVSIDIPSISSSGVFPRTITLLDYATIAGASGSAAFVLGQIPNRTDAVLNFNNGTQVDLTINGVDFPVWTGALNQVWTTAVQGNPENWVLNSNGTTPTDFRTRDIATFTDTATNTTVAIDAGDVSPAGVVFTNSTKNYTVTGASAIIGAGGITKSGSGRTEIVTVNSFTGAVTISGGTLAAYSVANAGFASALGAGTDISISGATLEYTGGTGETTDRPITILGAAAIQVGQDKDVTLSGTISGSGSLTKAGLGTLIVSGENSYAGNTVISGGVLQVGDVSATGTLGAGTAVANDGELIFDIPGDSTSPHGISGSGLLRKRGIGTLTASGNVANSYSGGTFIEGGTLLAAKTLSNLTIPGAMTLAFGGNFLLGAANQIADTSVVTIDGGAFGNSAASFADTFARIDLNTGDFSTGATLTGVNLTNRFQIVDGTAMISRSGAMTANRVDIHTATSNTGTLRFDGGSTTANNESKLTVGVGGLFLTGATVSFNTGNGAQSVVGGSSVGSILALNGTITATGTNVFENVGVAGPKANVDLLTGNRTINVVGLTDSLTLGTATAPVNVTNGGITKTGLGTLELPGTQTFAAASFVNAGKLIISGPVSASALTISDLATLEGTGSVGTATGHTVTVANGGTITVGDDNGLGTLNFQTLRLGTVGSDLSAMNFTFTSDAPTATPKVTVAAVGGLIPGGGAGTVSLNISGVVAGVGDYRLINYAGVIGGVGDTAFQIGSVPNRVTASLFNDEVNSELKLRVTQADSDVWSGALGTQWVSLGQANPKNWVLSSNPATAIDFFENDVVVFDDTALNTTIGINSNDVRPAAIRFRNNTALYSFTGSNGIAGTTNMVMEGAGTVELFTSNSFTGIPTFKSGTVRIGALNDIGIDGGVGAGNKLIFDGGKLDVNSVAGTSNRPITLTANGGTIATDGGLTLSGAITGTGRLTKAGIGVLSLIGANGAYGGGITITGGKLQFVNAASIGTTSQQVTLNGGTLEYNSGALLTFADAANPRQVIVGAAGGGISVPSGAVGDGGGLWFSLANALSGTGPLTKSGDSTLRLTVANATLSSNWTVTEGALETRVAGALGSGSVTLTGDTLTGKIGALVAQNMTVSNNIVLNGGALATRSGDATVFAGTVNIIGPSFVRMHSFTTTASPQNIGITGKISGTGSLTTLLAANTVSSTKALTISNITNDFSGTFGITKDQILLAQATGGVGKTLGSSTVELTGGILRIRDNGTGNSQNLTAYNTNNVIIQPVKNSSDETIASTSTIDVDRATANTGNTVKLGGLTLNGDPDPSPAKLTTLNLIAGTAAGGNPNAYNVDFNGSSSFNGNAAITSSNSSIDPTFNGKVSGSGTVTLGSAGRTLRLTNPVNDFSGSFRLPSGTALLSLPATTGTTLGTSTISLAGSALRIRDNGTGSNQTLDYGNNIAVGTGTSTIDVQRVNANSGNTINFGALSLGGTLNVTSANSYKLGFDGPTTLTAATTINTTVSAPHPAAEISLNGAVSGSFGITKTGSGRLEINNNSIVTPNAFTNLTLGTTAVVGAGTVGGVGLIPGNLAVTPQSTSATIAPGISTLPDTTGTLSVGGNVAFTANTTFTVELGRGSGPQPLLGEYDQLSVGTGVGNVSTGAITLANATLALTAPGGLQNSDIFFIMINDGEDVVNGIFNGRPEGTHFTVNGYDLTITYLADFEDNSFTGGNDVAIMVPEPTGVALLLGGLATVLGRRRRR